MILLSEYLVKLNLNIAGIVIRCTDVHINLYH